MCMRDHLAELTGEIITLYLGMSEDTIYGNSFWMCNECTRAMTRNGPLPSIYRTSVQTLPAIKQDLNVH